MERAQPMAPTRASLTIAITPHTAHIYHSSHYSKQDKLTDLAFRPPSSSPDISIPVCPRRLVTQNGW
jgi:hypothetical protein